MIKNICSLKGMKLQNIALLAGVFFWVGFTQAQESANASGGDATGSGGTVAYSVGQVIYTSHAGSAGTINQGVQHTYEVSTLSVEETIVNISLTAFPNPTSENLTLQISNYNSEKLSYQLFNIQGKLLNSAEIIGQQTQIDMNSLPAAMYFINVVNQENKKVQSFKIVKQ